MSKPEYFIRTTNGYTWVAQPIPSYSRMDVRRGFAMAQCTLYGKTLLADTYWLGCSEAFQQMITLRQKAVVLAVGQSHEMTTLVAVTQKLAKCFGEKPPAMARREGYVVIFPGTLRKSSIFWSLLGQIMKDSVAAPLLAKSKFSSLEEMLELLRNQPPGGYFMGGTINSTIGRLDLVNQLINAKSFSHPLFFKLSEVDVNAPIPNARGTPEGQTWYGGVKLAPHIPFTGFWSYCREFLARQTSGSLPHE